MSHAGEQWRLGHRPSLDSLRGVAILLVVACHVLEPWWRNPLGSIGVTMFFTLSGFLITALLSEEASARGRVRLADFYARRARRLLPALLAMVAVVGTFQTAVGIAPASRVLPVLAYVANWPAASGADLGLLEHTWSLAVEEQFYLLWPLAFLAARRFHNGPIIVAGAGVAASLVGRFALWDGANGSLRVYLGSDTNASAVLIGCILALLLHRGWSPGPPGTPLALVGFGAIGPPLAALPEGPGTILWAPVVTPLATVVLILAILGGSGGRRGEPALRYLGTRSYGIYLWHYPLVMGTWLATHSLAWSVVAAAASFGVAELSWRYVEQPFRRRRYSGDARGPANKLERDRNLVRRTGLANADAEVGGSERGDRQVGALDPANPIP